MPQRKWRWQPCLKLRSMGRAARQPNWFLNRRHRHRSHAQDGQSCRTPGTMRPGMRECSWQNLRRWLGLFSACCHPCSLAGISTLQMHRVQGPTRLALAMASMSRLHAIGITASVPGSALVCAVASRAHPGASRAPRRWAGAKRLAACRRASSTRTARAKRLACINLLCPHIYLHCGHTAALLPLTPPLRLARACLVARVPCCRNTRAGLLRLWAIYFNPH